jgi:membrane-associated protein
VAGIGTMNYRHYLMFSIVGGVAWIGSLILAGYFFGNIPIIKDNLVLMIIAIIFISFIPAIREYIKHRRRQVQ